jgi:hypothetical protein
MLLILSDAGKSGPIKFVIIGPFRLSPSFYKMKQNLREGGLSDEKG